jgi:hypothetical protein
MQPGALQRCRKGGDILHALQLDLAVNMRRVSGPAASLCGVQSLCGLWRSLRVCTMVILPVLHS